MGIENIKLLHAQDDVNDENNNKSLTCSLKKRRRKKEEAKKKAQTKVDRETIQDQD